MQYYKDSSNKVFGFEVDGSQDYLISADMVLITMEERDLILNPKQSKAKQIAKLTAECDLDVKDLNMSYLSALAADGEDEPTRVAEIRQEIADRKEQYLADVSAVKAST